MPSRPPGVLGAQAVAHAVVAGEVRGALGGRDQVVGGERVRRVRQVHRLDRRAELARRASSVSWNAFSTPGSMPSPRELLRHAEADALEVASRSGSLTGSGRPMRRAVARVRRRPSRASSSARVGDVAGERAGLVERGGEGDHPVAADRAVGRLEPDDPAQRGGLADRAAGVGADRPRRRAGGHRGRARRRRSRRARGSCPTGSASGRRRSSPSRSPSRTRPGWSCPAACAPRRVEAAARWSPCTAAGSPRGSSSRPGSGCPRCRRGP